jgi:hypothetical protein
MASVTFVHVWQPTVSPALRILFAFRTAFRCASGPCSRIIRFATRRISTSSINYVTPVGRRQTHTPFRRSPLFGCDGTDCSTPKSPKNGGNEAAKKLQPTLGNCPGQWASVGAILLYWNLETVPNCSPGTSIHRFTGVGKSLKRRRRLVPVRPMATSISILTWASCGDVFSDRPSIVGRAVA